MDIFWTKDIPLSSRDLIEIDSSLNKNTTQAVLRKLVEYEFIEVASIGYSGTVLTRLYQPLVSAEEYVAGSIPTKSMKNLIANFINDDNNAQELDDLEYLIKKKKSDLKRKKR